MTVTIIASILAAAGLLFLLIQMGYVNLMLWVSRKIYKHALAVQWRHAKASMREREAWEHQLTQVGDL